MKDESLRTYLKLIGRWWWLLVLGVLIPAAASYVLLGNEPPLYRAKTTLMVGTAIQSVNPDTGSLQVSNTLAQAYAELAKRRPVTQAVIERLGLQTTPDLLAKQITTAVQPAAALLEVSVVDLDPHMASLIASSIAEELVRQAPGSDEQDIEQREFTRAQIADLQTKIENVRTEIQQQQDRLAGLTSAADIEDAQQQLEALQQVESTYLATYASLLQTASATPNVLSIVEPAPELGEAVPNRMTLIVGLSGLAGLLLAFVAVLLIDYLEDKMHWDGPGQRSLLGLPVLGAVPHLPRSIRGLMVDAQPDSYAAEAIRALRTSVLLRGASQSIKVLLMSSATPQDGKSFITANLAAALAAAGQRTVVVDADMRRPVLHKLLQRPNLEGLSDTLVRSNGHLPDELPLQRTTVNNLMFMSAGKPPIDPTSLLTSPRFPEVIELLKEQFDIVLIDSPAGLAVPDVAVLAAVADGILLLVDVENTSRRTALRAKENLELHDGAEILGVILNRAHVRPRSYYYYSRRRD